MHPPLPPIQKSSSVPSGSTPPSLPAAPVNWDLIPTQMSACSWHPGRRGQQIASFQLSNCLFFFTLLCCCFLTPPFLALLEHTFRLEMLSSQIRRRRSHSLGEPPPRPGNSHFQSKRHSWHGVSLLSRVSVCAHLCMYVCLSHLCVVS